MGNLKNTKSDIKIFRTSNGLKMLPLKYLPGYAFDKNIHPDWHEFYFNELYNFLQRQLPVIFKAIEAAICEQLPDHQLFYEVNSGNEIWQVDTPYELAFVFYVYYKTLLLHSKRYKVSIWGYKKQGTELDYRKSGFELFFSQERWDDLCDNTVCGASMITCYGQQLLWPAPVEHQPTSQIVNLILEDFELKPKHNFRHFPN
jgi:hypothetical protein